MMEILITGGSGKIGFQLVSHFISNGFTVISTSRNKKKFIEDRQLSGSFLKNLRIIEVDFETTDSINTIISFLKQERLFPRTIIHNARSQEYLKIENDLTVTTVNFIGELMIDVVFPYRLTMEIQKINDMLDNVIFISSMYGVVAPSPVLYEDFHRSSPVNYGVAKAAQIHLTKELAVRLAPKIRVNCISFGGIQGRVDERFMSKYQQLNPQGKMMVESEVASPVSFLVSDNSINMTGQNIIVDGGWTIW